jgi:hypothetical protein
LNGFGRPGICFRRRLSTYHAATAPPSAGAELTLFIMHVKFLVVVSCFALVASSRGAPIITSLQRLDADQTGGANKAVFTLATFGGPVYQDYSFTYSSWPAYLNGAEMVRMVNTDAIDSDYALQLTLSRAATLYLLVDDRTTTAAQPWVSAQGFRDTGDTVVVWDFPYSVYAVTATAGTFTVRENGGSLNMYTVAVVPEPSAALLLVAAGAIFAGSWPRQRQTLQ